MDKPKGLNGETVWACEDVLIGTVSGEEYGYKQRNLKVGVNIRVERIAGPKQTVTHGEVSNFLDFGISVHAWNPRRTDYVASGAGTEMLRELRTVNREFQGKVNDLIALGEFHNNGLKAGCIHQPSGSDVPRRDGKFGKEIDLDAIAPCPETGYRYGHAWLTMPLPENFMEMIRNIFADADESGIYDSGQK